MPHAMIVSALSACVVLGPGAVAVAGTLGQLNHFMTGFDELGTPLEIPAIDPAGITYHAPSGHLFISDSEIDEIDEVFNLIGVNIFEVLETIGNTPIVRINKLAPPGVDLFVKVESFNPMGSVKDRMAVSVIEQAERDGALKSGQTVIEATSGMLANCLHKR